MNKVPISSAVKRIYNFQKSTTFEKLKCAKLALYLIYGELHSGYDINVVSLVFLKSVIILGLYP